MSTREVNKVPEGLVSTVEIATVKILPLLKRGASKREMLRVLEIKFPNLSKRDALVTLTAAKVALKSRNSTQTSEEPETEIRDEAIPTILDQDTGLFYEEEAVSSETPNQVVGIHDSVCTNVKGDEWPAKETSPLQQTNLTSLKAINVMSKSMSRPAGVVKNVRDIASPEVGSQEIIRHSSNKRSSAISTCKHRRRSTPGSAEVVCGQRKSSSGVRAAKKREESANTYMRTSYRWPSVDSRPPLRYGTPPDRQSENRRRDYHRSYPPTSGISTSIRRAVDEEVRRAMADLRHRRR